MSGLLLLGQDRVEHRLLNVRLERAGGGIDEGIYTVLKLRVFFLHVVLGAVISELYIAGERAHGLERAVELVNKGGRQHRARTQAASEHHVVGFPSLLCRRRPGRAASRVTW